VPGFHAELIPIGGSSYSPYCLVEEFSEVHIQRPANPKRPNAGGGAGWGILTLGALALFLASVKILRSRDMPGFIRWHHAP
jgi:hypothetical protein